MIRWRLFIGLFILFFQLLEVKAQCCSGGVPMSGNLGMPRADAGVLQAAFAYDFNNLNKLKTGRTTLDDQMRSRTTHTVLFELGYSFSDKLAVDLLTSYVVQGRSISTLSGETDFTQTKGIGDFAALIKYRVFPVLILGYGVKFPTGSSNKQSNNITLNADLQPGSGALDHIGYLQFFLENVIRATGSFTFTANHRWRGVNPDYLGNATYQFGNELGVIATYSDRILLGTKFLDPALGVRLRTSGRDRFNDFDFSSSGGEFVFLNGGLSFIFSSTFSLQVLAEIPVFARVNEIQVTPSYRLFTGIRFQLPTKKTL